MTTETIDYKIRVDASDGNLAIEEFRRKALEGAGGAEALASSISDVESASKGLASSIHGSTAIIDELATETKMAAGAVDALKASALGASAATEDLTDSARKAADASGELENGASSLQDATAKAEQSVSALASATRQSVGAVDSLASEARSASTSVDDMKTAAVSAASAAEELAASTKKAADASGTLKTETASVHREAGTAKAQTNGLRDSLDKLDRASAGSERALRSASGALGTMGNGAAETLGLVGDLAGLVSGGNALALAGALAIGTLAVEKFNKELEKTEREAKAAQAAIDAIRDPASKILKGSNDAIAGLRNEIEDLRLLGASEGEDAIQKITNAYARSVDGLREKIAASKNELERIRKDNDSLLNRSARGQNVDDAIARNLEISKQYKGQISDLEKAIRIADEEASLREQSYARKTESPTYTRNKMRQNKGHWTCLRQRRKNARGSQKKTMPISPLSLHLSPYSMRKEKPTLSSRQQTNAMQN